jgi:hypothetical protein
VRWTLIWRPGIATSAAMLMPLSASTAAVPGSGWRAVHVTAKPGRFCDVTAAGRRQAWAFGVSIDRPSVFSPLIARWDGRSWTAVRLPAKVRSRLGPLPLLGSAVASGPRNLWAFSLTVGGWLHFDGSSWTAGLVPAGVLTTTASVIAGSKYVWMFGLRVTFHNPVPFSAYATDINGKVTWKRKAMPGDAVIYGASAVSGSDLWAVGTSGEVDPIAGCLAGSQPSNKSALTSSVLHYYAGRWHKAPSLPAAMRENPATSILANGDNDLWVGGAIKNAKGGTAAAIAHWNGQNWTLIKLPAPGSRGGYRTEAITADGPAGLWAVADCAGTHCPLHGHESMLWHEHAGLWTGPIRPALTKHRTILVSLAASGPTIWAAGTVTLGKNNVHGLIAARTATATKTSG